MNMDEIYKSINELQGMVSVNLGVLSSRVNSIEMGNSDINYIEHTMDEILDCMMVQYNEGLPIFIKLLNYMAIINEEAAISYVNIHNELFDTKIRKL